MTQESALTSLIPADLPQRRQLVTPIPGPRSVELAARRSAAVAAGSAADQEHDIPGALTEAQVTRLLAAVAGESFWDAQARTMVACMLYAGLRRMEVAGLTWEAVNLDERFLTVRGKGRKRAQVPVGAPLFEALTAWRERHPSGTGPVFLDYDRRGGIGRAQVYHQVKKALVAAGLGGFWPHLLRHTFATRLLKRKVPITQIQKLMRHSQIATTVRYTHAELDGETLATLDGL